MLQLKLALAVAVLYALLLPISEGSAQTPIVAELDAPFVHEGSGITVPPAINRFSRVSVTGYSQEQLNIAAEFHDATSGTVVTLFIYRAASANVSIWGDFSAIKMLNNPLVGGAVSGSIFLGRFTPPNGSGADSAIHARSLVQGADANSTGLSIFAHDDWLVKVRATSKKLDEAEITKVIGDVIVGLDLPDSKISYPRATLVSPCKKPMSFEKDLVVKRYDAFGQINLALAIQQLSIAESAADSAEKPWCRDIQSTSEYGVYRRNNDKSEYFVALSDSGIGAFVSRARKMGIWGSMTGYLVKTSNGISEEAWPLFDKRPHPAFILSRYGSMSPIATQDVRPGSDAEATIILTLPDK